MEQYERYGLSVLLFEKQHGIDSAQRCMIMKGMQVKHTRRTASVSDSAYCISYKSYTLVYPVIAHSDCSIRWHYSVSPTVADPLTA
jgi:hypothetical protein